jgi:tRNA(fMet)-specific endonuclease VapC
VAAQLRANLNSQGTPIGAYALLLAACALRRGLKIVTHNAREFICVGGLGLEDWRSR